MQGKTSIIVPIRNLDYANCHYTGNCIGSIRFFTTVPYELILIDNASTCSLTSELEPLEKAVDKYFRFDENMGVSKAWNKGIAATEEQKEKCRIANLGKSRSPGTQFKKGLIPWNKGLIKDNHVIR